MISPSDVITPGYKALQVELHTRPEGYGSNGDMWAPALADLVTTFGATSVLDYGAGTGALKRALTPLVARDVRIDEYDPAVPGKDHWPLFADLVVCTDVLEHVEPKALTHVLAHLWMLKRKAVFAVIATRPAERTLSDGRNAHLIVESADWWIATLEAAGFHVEPGPASPHDKPAREVSVVLT